MALIQKLYTMRAPGETMSGTKPSVPPKGLNDFASDAMQGINRAQLTLQELQDLAERQRQQILYNSKELMEKQQALMRMHHDFRNRLKIQTSTLPPTSSPAPVSPVDSRKSGQEQDQYAKMLRQTYQSHMGKLHGMNSAHNDADIQKFNNSELAHELDRVRAVFKSKQGELANAVNKVDALTRQLDDRKNGNQNWSQMPTPERINRRRKIQAAKEELDRLRSELIVRNETNTHQNHQLQLQRDIIHEKKQELRQLNHRMNELGSALKKQYGSNFDPQRIPPNYTSLNMSHTKSGKQGGVQFNGNVLNDTLLRKRSDNIDNHYTDSSVSNNIGDDLSDGREYDRLPAGDFQGHNDFNHINGSGSTNTLENIPVNETQSNKRTGHSIFNDGPLSGKQTWKQHQSSNLTIMTDNLGTSSPLHSPTSSVSSLSSISSTELHHKYPSGYKESPPQPPPRTTPIGVLIDRNQPQAPPSDEFLANLRKHKVNVNASKQQDIVSKNHINQAIFNDVTRSSSSDEIRHAYKHYFDAGNTNTKDNLSSQNSVKDYRKVFEKDDSSEQLFKLKPPVAAKPLISPKPDIFNNLNIHKEINKINAGGQSDLDKTTKINVDSNVSEKNYAEGIITKNEITNDQSLIATSTPIQTETTSEENDTNVNLSAIDSWPSPPLTAQSIDGPSEPEEFQLSFADIDEINLTQTDVIQWNLSDSQSQSDDSSVESLDIPMVVPVIISVPPEKMPPSILKRPDRPPGPNRRIVLDPFALLLDSALEGEMDQVKELLLKIPDPSRPNAEGITALHNAVCGNHQEVVKFLVVVGCDINASDNNGWTPLHCAAFYNDTDLCTYLVEHGASVFATTYTDYQTPAHKCSQLDDNYDQCFAYLHECKENVGRINNGFVYGLYDYTAESDDELSFSCGDTLTIIRRGDAIEKEWWWSKNRNGDMGYIPCNLIGNFPRIAAEV